jgi:peroxiredoxin
VKNQVRLSAAALKGLLVILVAVGLLAAGCSNNGGQNEPGEYTFEDLGMQGVSVNAPDFTTETLDGGSATLSSFRGMPVLLNFWALDCPPCVEEMPFLNSAAADLDGEAAIVTVAIGDSPDSVQEFFGSDTINMTVLLDQKGYVASQYSVGFTPTTFLIDPDGVVRYVKVGPFASPGQIVTAMGYVMPGA